MASIDLTNLKPGTSYSVQIQAVGSNGTDLSDWSTVYTFVTPGLPSGTTNTAQSMQLGSGSMIFAGNPAPGALLSSGNSNTGNSALVMSNNTFQALKADGTTPLFKLDVNADTMVVNASNFTLDQVGNVGIGSYFNYSGITGNLTIGSSGNAVTVNSSGNVTISGSLTAGAVYVNADYWTAAGFQLGGGNGISYNYASDIVTIGNYGTGIRIDNAGGITLGSDATFNGNITSSATITGTTITGAVINTSASYPKITLSSSTSDNILFWDSGGNYGAISVNANGIYMYGTGSIAAGKIASIVMYGSSYTTPNRVGISDGTAIRLVVDSGEPRVAGTTATSNGLKNISTQSGGTASGGNPGDIILIY